MLGRGNGWLRETVRHRTEEENTGMAELGLGEVGQVTLEGDPEGG